MAVAAVVCFSACAIGFGGPATNITETGATLNGLVGSGSHQEGTYWFRYGETASTAS